MYWKTRFRFQHCDTFEAEKRRSLSATRNIIHLAFESFERNTQTKKNIRVFANFLFNVNFNDFLYNFIYMLFIRFLSIFCMSYNDLIKNRWALMYVSGLFADVILIMYKSRELGWWLNKMDELEDRVAIGDWRAGEGYRNIHLKWFFMNKLIILFYFKFNKKTGVLSYPLIALSCLP